MIERNNGLMLFGDFEELHNRIAGGRNNFRENIGKIKASFLRGENIRLIIGASRYNLRRLNKIAEFSMSLLGKDINLDSVTFKVFPVNTIIQNFTKYVEEVKSHIDSKRIDIILYDEELMNILKSVSSYAQAEPQSARKLLRLLGVICEEVFIGPQTIVFDPFHRCNVKCKHCWVHTPAVKHPREFLDRKFDFEIFKKIIDDASDMNTDGVIFQGDGEPLMYSKFMPMLRYARDKKLEVSFFTNGILFTEEKAEEIIELGVKELYCSLPAGTAQTYEKIVTTQPAETFYKIKNNLEKFMVLRRNSNEDFPRLLITHVIHALNCHELIDMAVTDAQIASDAVRFYLIRLDSRNGFLRLSPVEVEMIKKQIKMAAEILKSKNIEFVDNIDFQLLHYDKDTGAWSKDFFLGQGCIIGWYFNLIPAKYDMSFCCHLRTVGYLDKQSFRDAWDSIDYWRWRKQAKFLRYNTNASFFNGQLMYDEHCDHCDNHQMIIAVLDDLRKYGLYKYYNTPDKIDAGACLDEQKA